MGGVRYASIGFGVFLIILIGGAVLLRDAGEGALQAVFLIAFVACFAVYHGLDERAKRRESRDQ